MTLRMVDTPIPWQMPLPRPREDAWNPDLAPALVAAPEAGAVHRRLAEPGALVVTTGQQPGLLTGPAYTVYKALSARALARALERAWRRPVIPVYWVPGDDHDLAEAGRVSWIGPDGLVVTATLPERPPEAPLTPLSRQPLGDAILAVLDAFEASLPPGDHRARAVEWLRRHYRPEAGVAVAFAGAIAELLAPLGVACLDSTHPAVKRAAAPFLIRALAEARELDAALADRSARLAAEGREAPVAVGEGATLVFLDGALGRDRLVLDGRDFVTRRERQRHPPAALEAIARDEPARLSPNVLLRPVVESALLPTVAYLAGPAELRYLALAAPVYERLAVRPQEPVPRWSGVLVEPRVSRILDKYETTLDELLEPGLLEGRLARSALPAGADRAFGALKQAIEAGYEPVIRAATTVDPTLERSFIAAQGHAVHALAELEKKLLQHVRKREATEVAQIQRARAAVLPDGKAQERVLTLAWFLGRYGFEELNALVQHVDAWYARALEGVPPIP